MLIQLRNRLIANDYMKMLGIEFRLEIVIGLQCIHIGNQLFYLESKIHDIKQEDLIL